MRALVILSFIVAVVAWSLLWSWRACAYCICSACVSTSCKRADVSDASVHTSKLPPRGSVILNTTMQRPQPQATSGDQSDGSSDTSALRVQLINNKWVILVHSDVV